VESDLDKAISSCDLCSTCGGTDHMSCLNDLRSGYEPRATDAGDNLHGGIVVDAHREYGDDSTALIRTRALRNRANYVSSP
jgi:hypothetical protein